MENPFAWMRSWFIFATNVLVRLALDCYDIPLFSWLGDYFELLSDWTSAIAGYLYDAANWWDEVTEAIEDILSWSSIKSLIRNWLSGIEELVDWFQTWEAYVRGIVVLWWATVINEVQSWIDNAIENVQELISQIETYLNTLQSAWDNFTSSILPSLANLIEVNELISSWFKEFAPFWEGWLDWKDKVTEFFADPLQWLYDRVEEFFERFW